MDPSYYYSKIVRLCGLLAVVVAYILWIHLQHPLTHHARLDGSIGVLGGLYICSHPAANFIDLLFFQRHTFESLRHGWKGITWIVLNLIVWLLGCLVIIIGATRFA
jgi:hypothetical protein